MGVEERQARGITVELCPVCQAANIAGNKYCYGPVFEKHEKARFEFVPVVPAVLSEELVEKVARAMYATTGNPRTWEQQPAVGREDWLDGARAALRAAGFVSEPSTGGE